MAECWKVGRRHQTGRCEEHEQNVHKNAQKTDSAPSLDALVTFLYLKTSKKQLFVGVLANVLANLAPGSRFACGLRAAFVRPHARFSSNGLYCRGPWKRDRGPSRAWLMRLGERLKCEKGADKEKG